MLAKHKVYITSVNNSYQSFSNLGDYPTVKKWTPLCIHKGVGSNICQKMQNYNVYFTYLFKY
jgi:hypothetical protein